MNKQKFIVKNISTESNKLSAFLHDYVKSNNIPTEIVDDLRLVLEEIFINIVNYAFSSEETQDVAIELNHSTDAICITIIDSGSAFNPLADCKSSIESGDQCEGGMGIHIIKSLTDHQEYNRVNQHNVFRVTKHYTK